MAIRTIVVGTDLRGSGERALKLARQTAHSTSATLWLVHAIESEGDSFDELERLGQLCRQDGLSAQTLCEQGDPRDTILRSALSVKADLIAVGEPESSVGRPERALGSTAEQIISQAPCSVIVACGRIREDYRGARLAVAVDFSPNSVEAVRWARDVARATGGQVALIHVESSAESGGLSTAARARLERVVVAEGLESSETTVHVVEGSVGSALCQTADELGADLLFVGRRGQERQTGAGLGTTSQDCLRQSRVPLIVVRE